MKKKLLFFPLILLGICLTATSCMNSDDDDENIDQEWKTLNETRFNQLGSDASYSSLSSQSGNGKIYWKKSAAIVDLDNSLKITPSGKPEFTDTIVVRYEGWFIDKDGKKVIFDSTENPSLRSNIAYSLGESVSPYPNKKPMQTAVSEGLIDGWVTLLQDMNQGEERELCIPHQLGYRGSPSTYISTSGTRYTIIPAYTTLWFNVRLMKIIPMKGIKG